MLRIYMMQSDSFQADVLVQGNKYPWNYTMSQVIASEWNMLSNILIVIVIH
jgi:hypothetical protein